MTCPYCGHTAHAVAVCPKRLEDYYGTPREYIDDAEEDGEEDQ